MQLQNILWVVALLITSTFALSGTAGAEEAAADAPASADIPGVTSKKESDSWFHLDALDVNIYGLSYHPDRQAVHEKDLDNQVNPGLGLHYAVADSTRGTTFLEAGAYLDSGSNWARFAGVGYQFKISDHWKIGGAVAAVHSATYNKGTTFVGMIPLITYDLGRIKLNATYFPKVANYNQVDAFAFYISIPLGAWMK